MQWHWLHSGKWWVIERLWLLCANWTLKTFINSHFFFPPSEKRKSESNNNKKNFELFCAISIELNFGFFFLFLSLSRITEECIIDRCGRFPCRHGGKCLPSDQGAICLCPLGFGGDLCEMRLDLQVIFQIKILPQEFQSAFAANLRQTLSIYQSSRCVCVFVSRIKVAF